MKPLSLAPVLIALTAVAVALEPTRVTEEFHQTYSLSPSGRVSLENVNGGVRIAVWDRSEIRVDAIKRAEAREQLENMRIEVDSQSESIHIRTRYQEDRRNGGSVEYTITAPRGASLEKIKLVNGAIEVEGVTGSVEASSVNGAVRARDLGGDAKLSTVNGGVEASFRSLAPARSVALNSVNGSLLLALPQEAGAQLSASTVHGTISSDFDLATRRIGPVGANVEAVLGAGGARIEMKNVNGNVRISRAQK
ncbi:MAG: DUF4097 family beta strand repeat-containing protein [Bryobacteraceae bacterium]